MDERRVDAQLLRGHIRMPAAGKRLPRPVQPFDGEVAEVGLIQLPLVIAKFHVKITMEHALFLLELGRLQRVHVLEDVFGGLLEQPRLRVVVADHLHRNAQVPVPYEQVHSLAQPQLPVASLGCQQQEY